MVNIYQIEFTEAAASDLTKIDKPVAQRILKKIQWLSKNLDNINPEPLTGDLQGTYKLRVGDYRVVYTFERGKLKVFLIHMIDHRREIYKPR